MKLSSMIASTAVTTALVLGTPPPIHAQGEGRVFIGTDVGAMIPVDELDREADKGGTAAPFLGYMFNDYIGVMGQAHIWAAKTEDHPGEDDHTTVVAGGTIGPRGAVPIGPFELYATFQSGMFTSLASEALTDTSFGFSTGAGLNYALTDDLSIGGFGRWNRLYQRVHGLGDAKYVTTGLSVTYQFREEPEPPPPLPARAQAAPPPPPAPTPVERHVVRNYVLQGVHFDFDKAQLRAEGRTILDEAIAALNSEESHVVIVEGHTDSVGTEEYNERLSLRRAHAVHDYLVAGGIAASRIEVKGFGETQPVADNSTRDGRAQNRRVELKVMGY